MEVIFSKEFQRQLEIVRKIADKKNIDFLALYNRIGLCVKALESVNCIDDIPFELRFHKGNSNQKGHLTKPLENCLSVDLDGTTRFLTFEKKGNAIVVTSLGHYNISLGKGDLGKEITLFKSSEESVSDLDELLDDDNFYSSLKKESEQAKKLLLDSVKGVELTDTIIHSFDSNVTKDICPLSPDAVKCRITSALGAWEKQYKQEKNTSGIRFEDSQSRDNKVKELVKKYAVSNEEKKYTSLLERSIVNARCLSNAGAIVCGDKDPNMIAELKTMLDESWVKHFSDLIRYVNKKVSSVELKKELFSDMGKALLRSFDKKYDDIVEVDNEELRKLDENLRKAVFEDLKKAVIEDINNILELKDVTKYERIIKKTNQQSIFGRLFPKFTVAVQNLKSIFSGKPQTNEADNSVESVAFPKEQEENITKKEIAESQENQSLNNQEQSLSLERRKYMNRIQLKPEASNEETQKSDRMKMMQSNSNKERNNACDNVISTSQKKGRSR